MTPEPPLERFALDRFTGLDVVEDAEALSALVSELEWLALARLVGAEGTAGLEALIRELEALGHRFERRETQPGWVSWFQETHAGERHFWIHAERDEEDCSVMVLYDETLDASVARRRDGLSPEARADDARLASFYDRGLALSARADGAALTTDEALLLRLYLLETGVANGGLATWLENTGGGDLESAAEDLRRIGAPKLANALDEVASLLPPRATAADREWWEALDAHAPRLAELDARFGEDGESIARLTLDHLDSSGP